MMIDLGAYWREVILAYAMTLMILTLLIGWSYRTSIRTEAKLRALERETHDS